MYGVENGDTRIAVAQQIPQSRQAFRGEIAAVERRLVEAVDTTSGVRNE